MDPLPVLFLDIDLQADEPKPLIAYISDREDRKQPCKIEILYNNASSLSGSKKTSMRGRSA